MIAIELLAARHHEERQPVSILIVPLEFRQVPHRRLGLWYLRKNEIRRKDHRSYE